MQKKGNKYGTHRVIEPQGLLTQAAKKIDNTMECWSNEILCDVSALNIDSASFTQIYEACGKDLGKTEQMTWTLSTSAARCRTLSPAPAACSSAPSRRSARICRARST